MGVILRLTLLFAALFPAAAFAERLPGNVVPDHYDLSFTIDLARERFSGQETIRVRVVQATSRIVLHALDLQLQDVTIGAAGSTQHATYERLIRHNPPPRAKAKLSGTLCLCTNSYRTRAC